MFIQKKDLFVIGIILFIVLSGVYIFITQNAPIQIDSVGKFINSEQTTAETLLFTGLNQNDFSSNELIYEEGRYISKSDSRQVISPRTQTTPPLDFNVYCDANKAIAQFDTLSKTWVCIDTNMNVVLPDLSAYAKIDATNQPFTSPIGVTQTSTATTGQLFLRNDGTGDSAIKWGITGDSFIAGIDNSDGDAWKLSHGYNSIDGATFGTNDQIKIIGSSSTHYYNGGVFYFGNPTGPYNIDYYLNGQSKKLRMTWLEDEAEFLMSGGSMNHGKWVMPDIYSGFNKLVFGTGRDSSIGYDGDNMIINPKEVGSGKVVILGDLNISTKTTFKEDGNFLMTSPNGTQWNCGVSNTGVFSCS